MASKSVSMDTLLDWFDSQSAEVQSAIGDVSTSEGYTAALAAYKRANAGGEGNEEKQERTARPYRIMVLNETDSTFKDFGVHLGSAGRPTTDPEKFSPRQRVEITANLEVRSLRRSGKKASLVAIPVETETAAAPAIAAE